MQYEIKPVYKENTSTVLKYAIAIVDQGPTIKGMVGDASGDVLEFNNEEDAQAYITANLGLIDIVGALDLFDSSGKMPGLDAFFGGVTKDDLTKMLPLAEAGQDTLINALIDNYDEAKLFWEALTDLNEWTAP
jgi:hypothetical protein